MKDLDKRIDTLISKFTDPAYPGDLEKLKLWKKETKRSAIMENLSKHDGIKMIAARLRADVVEMRLLLDNADSEKLPDIKRDRVLDRKSLYIWFLGFFADIDKELKRIEKDVKVEEDYYEENKDKFL